MRKDSGFEVLDRISLYVSNNDKIEKIIKKFEDIIKHDTLADDIFYGENLNEYVDNSSSESFKSLYKSSISPEQFTISD